MMRKSVPFRVLNNLIPLSGEEYVWHSVGDNSLFSIDQLPTCGWSLLEFSADHNTMSASAHFYFDTGHGFSEEEKIVLPLRRGRVVKRLCYFSTSIRAIRFDPLGSEGKFTITHFRFKWLMPWVAHNRLLKRLINMHHLYHGYQKRQVIKEIKSEAQSKNIHWRDIALKRYDETFLKSCPTLTYSAWINKTEKKRNPSGNNIIEILGALSSKPIISIFITQDDNEPNYLRECIESVCRQSYPHWQLFITGVNSNSHIKSKLVNFEQDNRINLFSESTIKGSVDNLNKSLSLVEGEYLTLLGRNDMLAEHALLKMVSAINEIPDACMLYSDEDEIDGRGERFNPCFKPDLNLDLLLSQNYISHSCLYKTTLINNIGGFRKGFEGGVEYDLMLRCISQLQYKGIVHVPEVLYHHRFMGSSDNGQSINSDSSDVGVKALTSFFKENHKEVIINPGLLPGTYKVNWPIPEKSPLVSIIIPTKDNHNVFKCCLASILEKTAYDNFEVIILNNQTSCRETLEYFEKISGDQRVTVYDWNYKFNYSAINNYGVKKANGSIIAFLNNDVEVISADWMDEMVSHACRDEIGCVGAKLYYADDTIQHAGVILGVGGIAGHAHKYFGRDEDGYFSRLKLIQNYSAVTGACLIVRKSVFEQVGGFDEKNLTVALNDVDFCLKVREDGYRNLWTPYAELYHLESHTRGENDSFKKRKRADRENAYMRKKWGNILFSDPAYNPNMTLVHEDFSLK